MIEKFLESASTYAADIDGLILLVTLLVGFWFIVAEVVFFGLIFKYRAKEGVKAKYVTGKERYPKRFINIAHYLVIVFDIVIIVAAIRVWMHVKQTLPEPDAVVRVVGQQWTWTFDHPGPDGKLDTADDITTVDELHVEVGKVYHFLLESRDVVHCFSVPVFRLKQDTVPGRTITGWFEATKTGTFDIQCAELCGIGHGVMVAQIIIESHQEHVSWVNSHATVAAVEAAAK